MHFFYLFSYSFIMCIKGSLRNNMVQVWGMSSHNTKGGRGFMIDATYIVSVYFLLIRRGRSLIARAIVCDLTCLAMVLNLAALLAYEYILKAKLTIGYKFQQVVGQEVTFHKETKQNLVDILFFKKNGYYYPLGFKYFYGFITLSLNTHLNFLIFLCVST